MKTDTVTASFFLIIADFTPKKEDFALFLFYNMPTFESAIRANGTKK